VQGFVEVVAAPDQLTAGRETDATVVAALGKDPARRSTSCSACSVTARPRFLALAYSASFDKAEEVVEIVK
jgi:hypothetical protein